MGRSGGLVALLVAVYAIGRRADMPPKFTSTEALILVPVSVGFPSSAPCGPPTPRRKPAITCMRSMSR
jgi:hypothetical protein